MKRQHSLLIVAILLVGLSFTLNACSGSDGPPGPQGPAGPAGPTTLTSIVNSAPSGSCPNGGITVNAGLDTNGNTALDSSEISSIQYVCNGANGTNGTNGTNGINGTNGTNGIDGTDGTNGFNALVAMVTEPSGSYCPSGGKKINVGLDIDRSGGLDNSEITSWDYVCNGAAGVNGTNGTNGIDGTNGFNSLVAIVTEPSGSNCANGGLKVSSGLDSDRNSMLDGNEAGPPSYVCNLVNTGNVAPIAHAGQDQTAFLNTLVTLDGSQSSDPDEDVLTFAWSVFLIPPGSRVTTTSLSDSFSMNPTFFPDKAGLYVFKLVVNDGAVNSAADKVTIKVRAVRPIPDTGQTGDYTTSFGEDSDYSSNLPSYTDLGNGIILDNVTGLLWQKSADTTTRTIAEAQSYCVYLTLAGYGEWRLPYRHELASILDLGAIQPKINSAYFSGTQNGEYWTGQEVAGPSRYTVNFSTGAMDSYDPASTLYVRCTHGSYSIVSLAPNYKDNSDGTVTDTSTGLMWQQGENTAMLWKDAIVSCESSTLAGYSDWRLPNMKEMESLTDFFSAGYSTFFPNHSAGGYWTSTVESHSPSDAYVFNAGGVQFIGHTKATTNDYFRCVRSAGGGDPIITPPNVGYIPTLSDKVNYSIGLITNKIGAVDGITLSSAGDMYFTDYKGWRVLKMTSPSLPGFHSYDVVVNTGISYPADLAFRQDGRLFVTSDDKNVVEVLPNGSTSIYSTGYSYPSGISSYGNTLYVSSGGNGKIFKIDPLGNSSIFISGLSTPSGPYHASIDILGNLYFVDHATGKIYSSDQSGNVTYINKSVTPYGGTFIAISPNGNLYVADCEPGNLYKIDTSGNKTLFASGFVGKSSPPAIGPTGIAFDNFGNMYVGDGDNMWKISDINSVGF